MNIFVYNNSVASSCEYAGVHILNAAKYMYIPKSSIFIEIDSWRVVGSTIELTNETYSSNKTALVIPPPTVFSKSSPLYESPNEFITDLTTHIEDSKNKLERLKNRIAELKTSIDKTEILRESVIADYPEHLL